MPDYTSGQITEKLRHSLNVDADKQQIFDETRYFVAQKPATNDFTGTVDGFYRGHKVIPGPKADPALGAYLNVKDIRIAEAQYHIRFVDNATTQDADEELKAALFVPMSKREADEYEDVLRELKGIPSKRRGKKEDEV